MKSKNNQSSNLFTGRYKIVSLYANIVEQDWILFKRYYGNRFIWEFTDEKMLNFPSGEVAYEGRLIEHIKGKEDFITEYAYYPKDMQLYIDRSDYAEGGFCNICINDIYRVEQVSSTQVWLYDLEDVENEPEDYRFKMKLTRV